MSSLERSPTSSFDEKTPADVAAEPVASTSAKRSWFRSTLFQATVVGAAAFCSPGMWNGMNALGAGGAQEPFVVNAANSLVFGLMVVTCLFGSSIVNKIGYRWALVLGTAGYAPYAGGLVLNKKSGANWLIFVGSTTCGLSAGLFWAVEGAIIMGYPEAWKRGRYLAYWLGFRNAGQILSGIISLSLNAKSNKAGSISTSTYYVFIALQALAPFIGMLLSNPGKVQRKDRTPVKMENHIGFVAEMKQLWELVQRKEVLLLVPISIFAQWPSSYASTYLSLYFSVRARSLGALSIAILGVIVNAILGFFMDNQKISKKTRFRAAFIAIMSLFAGVWIWFIVLQLRFIDHPRKLDWSDPGFAGAWTLYLIFQICYFLIQNYLYLAISQLAQHPHELVRLSSFLRGLESAGSACGYGVSASKHLPYTVPLGINIGLYGVATICASFTVWDIGGRLDFPSF
ncbi:hypothetical protein JCM10207_000487 [Rhodosporidiobolus poonsookiae]